MAPSKPRRRGKHAPRPRRRAQNGTDLQANIAEIYRLFEERGAFMDALRRDLDTQFKRIAEIQAELDHIKRTQERLKSV